MWKTLHKSSTVNFEANWTQWRDFAFCISGILKQNSCPTGVEYSQRRSFAACLSTKTVLQIVCRFQPFGRFRGWGRAIILSRSIWIEQQSFCSVLSVGPRLFPNTPSPEAELSYKSRLRLSLAGFLDRPAKSSAYGATNSWTTSSKPKCLRWNTLPPFVLIGCKRSTCQSKSSLGCFP